VLIDDVLPAYQFGELHSLRVHAAPDEVLQAIRDVAPEEIRLFRLLTAIRSLPARLLGRGAARSPSRPLLETALHAGFLALVEDPGREVVFGTVGQFWRLAGARPPRIETPEAFASFDSPGYAKAAITFRVDAEAEGWSRVTTETRVAATDAGARRKFAAYWCLIYPGSALIRRMWLAAIRRRAEGSGH
jgi:hypothetical protein